MNVDLLVVGEIAIDTLDGGARRPGGVLYSASAARALGAKAAVAGPLGSADPSSLEEVRTFMGRRGIVDTLVHFKPGHSVTEFKLVGTDEVDPVRRLAGSPLCLLPFELPEANVTPRAILLYRVHTGVAEAIVRRWPEALIAADLQYDIGSLEEVAGVLRECKIVFASSRQLLRITGLPSVEQVAERIMVYGPDMVVMKFGQGGSCVYTRESRNPTPVPSYYAEYRHTVGAGDVYNATFLIQHLQGKDQQLAGQLAAAATAHFTEADNGHLLESWTPEDELTRQAVYVHPDDMRNQRVYLAGPFFDEPQRAWYQHVHTCLIDKGFSVFSPLHEGGVLGQGSSPEQKARVFRENIDALHTCTWMVALLDGADSGTMTEIGYAYCRGVRIVGVHTGSDELNLMVDWMVPNVVSSRKQLLWTLFSGMGDRP